MEVVAPQIAVTLTRAPVTDKAAIEDAIRAVAEAPGGALMVMLDVFMLLHRQNDFQPCDR